MDDFEKRVLRSRKSTFAESVKMDVDFLNSVRRVNLINDDVVQIVKSEKDAAHRASHLIDHVMASHVSSAFDVFTNLLMTDYAWLAKELQSDLKAEQGNLEIDDDVMKEAGMLVHRKFGTSKRISEMDKKDMQELIAVKIQISKQEWKEEIGTLQAEIHRLQSSIGKEDKKAREIDRELDAFVRKNEARLMSLALGRTTTSEALRTATDDSDPLAALHARVKSVITRVKIVMDDRDLLFDDREKCFAALGAGDSGSERPNMLSELIIQQQKGNTKEGRKEKSEVAKLKEELENKEKVIQRLRHVSSEYEQEIDGNESKVKGIKDNLAASVTENLELNARIKQMEQEMAELRSRASSASSSTNGKKGRRSSKT